MSRTNSHTVSASDVYKRQIYDNLDIYKPATVITVDGQETLVLESEEQAENILEFIKKPYEEKLSSKENTELLDISFAQEVKLTSKDVLVDNILSFNEARDKVSVKDTNIKTYKVATGDNAWNISRANNVSLETLEKVNPERDIEKLMPGDTINLSIEDEEKPIIDVSTKIRQTVEEEIDYKIKKEKDSSMYVGQSKVKQEGKKGTKKIVKEIYYNNDDVKDEQIISEETLKEPVEKIVLVGTKARQSSRNYSSRKAAPVYKGNIGSAIVSTAKHYIGVPYRRGGSLPSGFDCSGFVQYVYRQYGISIPRTTGGQGSAGGYVARGSLKPGDIVYFGSHTGIYVGNNSFIHSPSTGKSVQITSLSSSYWSPRFRGGRRVY